MPSLKTLFSKVENVKVIDVSIPYAKYVPIDLSTKNTNVSEIELSDSKKFDAFIQNYLQKNDAKVAFGGYNEKRNLYKSSPLFNENKKEERNIHLGIDFWTKVNTPVLAALEGKVHSFNYNSGKGNYGATIILKHCIENKIFYTLYGHLSIESFKNLEIGTTFQKGEKIATLGNSSINGGYAPHLHFQIIKDIQEYSGDYLGVCSKINLDFYLKNCPNPDLLLKIQ